jgi:membrane protease YdiL (CAAX protease family)
VRTRRLLGLVLGLLALTAVISPWIATGLGALGFDFKFSRVYNRIFEVLLVLAIVAGWRRFDLGSATQIGLRHPRWREDLRRGLWIGVAGVGTGVLVCWLGGAMVPRLRHEPAQIAFQAAAGLLGAGIVAIGEEALFRGVLLRRFTADMGRAAGVLLSTAIYAVVHALRPGGSNEVYPMAGIDRTGGLFAPLAEPGVLPSIVGLFGLGLLLAVARLRGGSLWLPIGIHAAYVAVFRVGRLLLDIRKEPVWLIGPGWPPLIGGAAGYVALVVTAALLAVALRRPESRGRHAPQALPLGAARAAPPPG